MSTSKISVDNRVMFGESILQTSPPEHNRGPIILHGYHQGKKTSFQVTERDLSKHTLFLGSTGTGKTNLLFHFVNQIKQTMTEDDVMLIFDSKGDFYHEFATANDYVIGNSSAFRKSSVKWNVYKEFLADGREDSIYTLNIREICRALFDERIKKTTNVFFPMAACDLLCAIFTAIVRDSIDNHEYRTKFFFNDSFKDMIGYLTRDRIIENLSSYPDLNFVRSYIEGDTSQAQGVLSELYSIIREIFIGVFADHGGFSIREFVRQKKKKNTVY